MQYLVTMTTHVPDETSEEAVADARAREAAHTRELAAQGHVLRLWRSPLAPGEWRTLGLFAAADWWAYVFGDLIGAVIAVALIALVRGMPEKAERATAEGGELPR